MLATDSVLINTLQKTNVLETMSSHLGYMLKMCLRQPDRQTQTEAPTTFRYSKHTDTTSAVQAVNTLTTCNRPPCPVPGPNLPPCPVPDPTNSYTSSACKAACDVILYIFICICITYKYVRCGLSDADTRRRYDTCGYFLPVLQSLRTWESGSV